MEKNNYSRDNLPVTVDIVGRGIVQTPEKVTFHFKLRLACDGREMFIDYSGGILAFGPYDSTTIKQILDQEKAEMGKNATGPMGHLLRGKRLRNKENEAKLLGVMLGCAKIDAADVCECLVADTNCAQESFEDFCSNCGYDEDSRKAFSVWETCVKQGREFIQLIGGRKEFQKIEEALQEA